MGRQARPGSAGGERAPPRTPPTARPSDGAPPGSGPAGGGTTAAPEVDWPRPPSRRLRPFVPYALLAPSLVVLAAVLAWPMYQLVAISFQRYGLRELLRHQGVPVGLANYRTILTDPFFWQVVVRTVLFDAVCVALTMAAGTLIALLLARVGRRMRLLVTVGMVFAWAMPTLTSVAIWQWMFDYEFGVANWLLTRLHVGNFINHNWFDQPVQGLSVIVLVVVWRAIPFVAITLHAGLTQVPAELTEAALVDGANPWRLFWRVTFPLMRPIFLILATLSTIWDFKVFTQIWVMLNQRPGRDYFLLGVWAYNESFGVTRYGLGAAIAVVTVLLLMLLTSVYVRQMLRSVEVA